MYTLTHILGCTIILTTFVGMLILEIDEILSSESRIDEELDRLEPGDR